MFDVMEVSDVTGPGGRQQRYRHRQGLRPRARWATESPFDVTLRFTDTYIKRDGRWQAWASQATMIPKAADTSAKN
jgi:hypothetical protein